MTIDDPVQLTPVQLLEQGSVLVIPSVVQDHTVWEEIFSTLVAAINPHRASSWAVGHMLAGRVMSAIVVKQKGVHVNNGLEPESVTCKNVNVPISHKLDGTVPKMRSKQTEFK